ncbi:MAG TPA: SURF1 family protein [Anaerolineae bacterium]|nr:SURF1 family protein [Anaerolineae bacterium]
MMFDFKVLWQKPWRWPTVVVILGMLFLARLGFWQLDRLAERRAENEILAEQLASEVIVVTGETTWPADLERWENRIVVAEGEFDLAEQRVWTQQRQGQSLGVRLLAPLRVAEGKAILVDRGWLPAIYVEENSWSEFDVTGTVVVTGYLQMTQPPRQAQVISDERQVEWYRVDVEAIEAQLPYELAPMYVWQRPDSVPETGFPQRGEPDVSLSEGNHLSYALQWFSFSLILGIGYIVYVGQQVRRESVSESI